MYVSALNLSLRIALSLDMGSHFVLSADLYAQQMYSVKETLFSCHPKATRPKGGSLDTR